MFEFVRTHTKIIMVVLFLLVIPSFVLMGIEGYTRSNSSADKVARVDGVGITQTDWDNAHRREVDRIRAADPKVDLKLLDTPEMKLATLDRLVQERVLAAAANHAHLVTTDARLAKYLQQDPSIAQLRKPDGSLDMDRYRQLLAAQGLTPEGFENNVRAELSTRQVLAPLAQSSLSSPAQAEAAMGAFLEKREVQVARFLPADFAAKVAATDADVEAYYKANVGQYQAPEQASIEYVVLSLDDVKKTINVSEQELKTYYEQNLATFGTPEERRIAHILIAAPRESAAAAAERDKAKAKAEQLLAELRQNPTTFAAVAKRDSQDDTSAAAGGDLGFFVKGKGIDPTLNRVAFELAQKGDLSGVVQSDFGFHIVQLADVKPAAAPTFDQMRAKLEDQFRTQQAQQKFGELAETFTNAVYEQADSLKPVAEKLKLPIQTAAAVLRNPQPGAVGALANAKFLSALFSNDAVQKKRNTEAVEFGTSQLVSGRIVQYAAAHARPLAEVKDVARQRLIAQKSAEMAVKEGEAKLAAWRTQPASATSLPAAVVVSRDQAQSMAPRLVEAVLRADASKPPTFVGVDLGPEGYAVAKVNKVLPHTAPSADVQAQGRTQYEQGWNSAELMAYYNFLKKQFKADVLAAPKAGEGDRASMASPATPAPGAAR